MMPRQIIDLTNMTPEMTRELNEIAKSYRKKYTEFIDELSLQYGKEEFWWDTPLASRYIGCSCFGDICRLQLVLRLSLRQEIDEVIVADGFMRRAIMSNANIRVRIKHERKHLRQIITTNHFAQGVRLFYRVKHRIDHNSKNLLLKDRTMPKGEVTIVSTYAIPEQLRDGNYQDRYFPGLQENTSENILFFYYPVYTEIKKGEELMEFLAGQRDSVISDVYADEEDLKEVHQYIKWCNHFRVKNCSMDGMDVTALVNKSLYENAYNNNVFFGIIRGNAICRMIEDRHLQVKRVIDWYEGQPSSNGMLRRLRKKYSDVMTIGYMLSPCPENLLGISLSEEQILYHNGPEYIGIQGRMWGKTAKQFSENVKVIDAPSFRHQGIFQSSEVVEGGEGFLLILPYIVDWARQLLYCFFKSIEEENGFIVCIKNHPANRGKTLDEYGIEESLYNRHSVSFTDSALMDAVQGKSRVLISQSTATLEILLTGIDVVCFIPKGELSFICLPEEVSDEIEVVYELEEMKRILRKPKRKIGKEKIAYLRSETYTKVNPKTVGNFLCES